MPDQHENETTDAIELCGVPPAVIAPETSRAKDEPDVPPDVVAEAQDDSSKQRSNFRTFAIMIALFSTLFISALNTTIVSTAIPTICADLHSASGYSWIGGAYVIASTAAAPVWAKLSDIWGRKPILLVAVVFYFGSSVLCAVSHSVEMLIAGRALQGASGAGTGQLVNIVISDIFSMRTRPLYLALTHVIWAIAGGVGPVLGGAFTQFLSWRWIFWINLPVTGAAFILLLMFLDVHNPKTKFADGIRAVDWVGSITIVGIMVMVLLGLNFGGTVYPWGSPKVICLVVVGALMLVIFVVNEQRFARHPLMPIPLFRNKSNIACFIVGSVHYFSLVAAEYYLPLYFQSVKEASPLRSGILILPLMIIEASMGVLSGVIVNNTGRYLELIWIGLCFFTLGNGLYILLGANTPTASIIGFQLVAGIGAGLLFDPPLIAVQALVSQKDTATATSTLGFIRNLGTSLSIVVGGIVFQNGMQLQKSDLQDHGLPADLVANLTGGDAAANVMAIMQIPDEAQRLAVKEAFAWSLRNVWILCTCMAAAGILASGLITKAVLSKEHTETKTGLNREPADTDVKKATGWQS